MKRISPSIGYLIQVYPDLTTTFIYREVMALKSRGLNIDVFSVWTPDPNRLSPDSKPFMASTYYALPLSWSQFILRHLYFLVAHPRKYIGTALFILSRPGENWKNRLRTVYHFSEAVYIAREVQKRKISHLHAHFAINAASIALIISRLLDISFSFTAHNCFFTDRLLLKEKVREAKFISVISEFSREFLLGLVSGDSFGDKMHIVHCGISPDQFSPPDPRQENSTPILFFVSQLQERKGAPVLVQACKVLKERGVSFHCILAGDGPEKPEVVRLIDQEKLIDCISLPGAIYTDQIREYLKQADVFVLPCIVARTGDIDGIPVVLMEAMACEVAVVSTQVSGIPELIENGESGLLVPENDAVALADALQRLIEDKEFRLHLAKNGRQKVIREFNVNTNAARLAALFESYLAPETSPVIQQEYVER